MSFLNKYEVTEIMKKGVIVIITVLAAILLTIGILFLVGFFDEKDAETTNTNQTGFPSDDTRFLELLKADTVSELKDIAKDQKIELLEPKDSEILGLDRYTVDFKTVSLFVEYEADKITELSAKIELSPNDIFESDDKYGDIQYNIEYSKQLCSILFDVDVDSSFNFFHNEGYIMDQDMTEAYELFLNKMASARMIVKVDEQSYWKIRGLLEEGNYVLYLDRIFANIDNEIADIVLEKAE